MNHITLKNNEYQFGHVALLPLAEQFGSPLYVYDSATIVKQIRKLKKAFSKVDVGLKYALKALNNQAILQLVRSEGMGLDAVSIQEIHLGLRAGFKPEDILFTPNGVAFSEIEEAVAIGVKLNIDNIPQLEHFGHVYGNKVPVCVRINPHIMAGGNKNISVGHIDSKFGISVYQVPHIAKVVKQHNIKVEGLHMHTGSDILDAEVFLQGAELLFGAAEHFKDLAYIDMGSGFKVAYKDGDITTDIDDLGEKLSTRFNEFCEQYGRKLQLCFEPGKFIVSESGVLLVKVNVVKQTLSSVFAGVNSGQNHLIRPMFYDSYHHIVNISNPTGPQRLYTVTGYICETDTLGYDRKLSEVREGDILAIYNAGAYGYSMSNNYNARFRPAEVLIHKENAHLIRRAETIEDILATQVPVELK